MNPRDGGAWWAAVYGVAQSRTQLKRLGSSGVASHIGFPGSPVVKNTPVSARYVTDMGSVPGSGRSPGGRNGNPLQHSCLENPRGRGAWWLQSMLSQRVGHNIATEQTRMASYGNGLRIKDRLVTDEDI